MRNFFLVGAFSVVLAGCGGGAPHIGSMEHYEKCAANNTSFIQMVECGKRSRTEHCSKDNTCSGEGNMNVAYADSLVLSVKNHEMTEAEAWRKWIAYRNDREDSYKSINAAQTSADAQAAAAAAANRTRFTNCTGNRSSANCFTY